MRRRPDAPSPHRAPAPSTFSPRTASDASTPHRSKPTRSSASNLNNRQRFLATFLAIALLLLIISGNNDWPPKRHSPRRPSFLRSAVHPEHWDMERQIEVDGAKIKRGELQNIGEIDVNGGDAVDAQVGLKDAADDAILNVGLEGAAADDAVLEYDDAAADDAMDNGTDDQYDLAATTAQPQPQQVKLLSTSPFVKVTASVRGNLGPATVLNQSPPGTNWMKDRWQAASDLHGTAIKGQHWVIMQFAPMQFRPSGIILDWETALSTDYLIQGRVGGPPPPNTNSKTNANAANKDGNGEDDWIRLFDSKIDSYESRSFGQSPGVKQKLPLHIVHNVTLLSESQSKEENLPIIDTLRILIRSSDKGWGVSLWQVDVYGSEMVNNDGFDDANAQDLYEEGDDYVPDKEEK